MRSVNNQISAWKRKRLGKAHLNQIMKEMSHSEVRDMTSINKKFLSEKCSNSNGKIYIQKGGQKVETSIFQDDFEYNDNNTKLIMSYVTCKLGY